MELSQIRYFYEAATTQNLSRAAEKLNVSQPSLTKSIQHLEDELGVQLFDRAGRRITLNENGRRLMREVEPLLERLDEIRDRMTISGTIGQKKLVIGICGENDVLSRCLSEYISKNPDVRLEVHCNVERITRLDISEYDMLLYSEEDENFAKYDGVSICSDRLMLAVHRGSPFYDRLSATPDELKGQRLVVVRTGGEPSEIDRMLMRAGVKYGDLTLTDGQSQQLSLVRAGLGIAPMFLSTCTTDSELHFIRLEGKKDMTRKLNICFKRDKLLSETGKEFKKHVLEFFRIEA